MKLAHKRGRDTSRSPVHWDSSKNCGFTEGEKAWNGICDNYEEVNVADDMKNPNSVL